MAMYIVKPWYRKKDDAIYGAEWAGTSDPSWVRTDSAVGFVNPNPYYAGMSGSPSSPFDNISPWKDIRRVTDSSAGELVEIPKFYYKWTRDGAKMKLQISMTKYSGFLTSPAHADKGDGVGERDYIYIGRYKCGSSNYKSVTGVYPEFNHTRSSYRTSIHNLGSNIYQNGFSAYWTICILYLVEYAHWGAKLKIGYGSASNQKTGVSDSMPYHTGTMQSSRSTRGAGVQYRYIEDLWGNGYEYVDGIRFSNRNAYIINNPQLYDDENNGTNVGIIPYTQGNISSWNNPANISGYEYALVPASVNGEDYSTYTCSPSYAFNSNDNIVLDIGGYWGGDNENLFTWIARPKNWSDGTPQAQTSRLMVLPSQRIA